MCEFGGYNFSMKAVHWRSMNFWRQLLSFASLLFLCERSRCFSNHLTLPKENIKTSTQVLLGDRASLPCSIQGVHDKDVVLLVLWYKDSELPFYSFDARKSISFPRHWSSDDKRQRTFFRIDSAYSLARNRSWVDSKSNLWTPKAFLDIDSVELADEGIYRCMADFMISSTRNTIVNLSVIVPPSYPVIYNSDNEILTTNVNVQHSRTTMIGPYAEGHKLRLRCDINGGRPAPSLEWTMNNTPLHSNYVTIPGKLVRSTLIIDTLERKHLNSVIECRGSNYNYSSPVSSTVIVDMNLKPLNISLVLPANTLKAGEEVEVTCESWGSKPSAIISWWKDGRLQLTNSDIKTSHENHRTISRLLYKAATSDNKKQLTCRAQNPSVPSSVVEDGTKLDISYIPILSLQLGSNLDASKIKEGDDVYFECHINANPSVSKVIWLHNGSPLRQNVSIGVIVQHQVLAIQKILKKAAGRYQCIAFNVEGKGLSNEVNLDVLYKPYCKYQPQLMYGASLHEKVPVTCRVEAKPGPVTFRWTFNNTSEHLPISSSTVSSEDFSSIAVYVPKDPLDYGTILCWAFNSIGEQRKPCVFTIIPATAPEAPGNCSIANQTINTIEVECDPGYDGGMAQTFFMEVYHEKNQSLYRNVSSSSSNFLVEDLRSGIPLLMVVYSSNFKGRSSKSYLETFTLKIAEKRLKPPSAMQMKPLMGLFMGMLSALLAIGILIGFLIKCRRKELHFSDRLSMRGEINASENKAEVLCSHSEKSNFIDGTDIYHEDVDPDVIPQEGLKSPVNPTLQDYSPSMKSRNNQVTMPPMCSSSKYEVNNFYVNSYMSELGGSCTDPRDDSLAMINNTKYQKKYSSKFYPLLNERRESIV